jgi:hypothetical protein
MFSEDGRKEEPQRLRFWMRALYCALFSVGFCALIALTGCFGPKQKPPQPPPKPQEQTAATTAPSEFELRKIEASDIYPERKRELVKSFDFHSMSALPTGWTCYGAGISLSPAGLRYTPQRKAEPAIVMDGIDMDSAEVTSVSTVARIEFNGSSVSPKRLRFFWRRASDPIDPSNNWPFSEERQTTLTPFPNDPASAPIGRLCDQFTWRDRITSAFLEMTVPDEAWNDDMQKRCAVVLESIQFWKGDAPSKEGRH